MDPTCAFYCQSKELPAAGSPAHILHLLWRGTQGGHGCAGGQLLLWGSVRAATEDTHAGERA